ncbi:MAG: divergent polysaccharide deacetylase family protein [Candidatus Acidiferrales bacterium]
MIRARGNFSARFRHFGVHLLLPVACALVCLIGCHKKSASRAEIRSVTVEIVAAAQRAAGHKLEIEIHPEEQILQAGATEANHESDSLYIPLENPAQADTLERSLSEIARRHKLTVDESSSAKMLRVDFSRTGIRTHSIHIIFPLTGRLHPAAGAPAGGGTGPRLAIIIDDMGHDRAPADELLALPIPLTISILPHLPLSAEVAEEAFRRGDQVLLHLPMEPEAGSAGGPDGVTQEPIELRVGMSPGEVNATLAGMLETVPHAAGVNNHEGSRATADDLLMQALMPDLRARNLFFIDSRTTAATVAYSTAEKDGVPAASRKVFLDDTPTQEAVLAQLELAAKDAYREGSAIAIGHPHRVTIAVLAQEAPALQSRGIRLVFASDLVR